MCVDYLLELHLHLRINNVSPAEVPQRWVLATHQLNIYIVLIASKTRLMHICSKHSQTSIRKQVFHFDLSIM